jgi:hypothetical protein
MGGDVPRDWREYLVTEFHGLRFAESKRSVRWDRFKYTMNFASVEELYDLQDDPWEMQNLVPKGDHDSTIRQMRAMLLEHMKATDDQLGHAWYLLL